MKSPINGLVDLMYIVVFGVKPYGVEKEQGIQPATRDEILHYYEVEYLACHHADPNVVLAGHSAATEGRTVAFENPLGIYIRSFARQLFLFQNMPVSDRWVRWSRGKPSIYQRLEFGPDDEEEIFLDDISILIGENKEPLTGGYQLLRHMEIGPLVLLSEPSAVTEQEWVRLTPYSGSIHCVKSEDCLSFRKLIHQYETAPKPNNS
ncbi:hypothetical protein [Paenibacillus sp. Soil787]|uniref:hypothetical protein n=1 Tax=Paenibacillus sp. Soil787 TaxID=1736411 RepID=UPI000703BABB|nr:hypothetical protein [Paenibacillus sp. Soil787]KRF21756.1 hypothetical protein ASG93_30670 [Paenibacillus sp. Soil787]